MTSSESEVLGGRSRKRSRGSAEDGGVKGVKKTRGRPRVDAPEQGDQELTAADVSLGPCISSGFIIH
jgi:hypothetical protein